MKFSKIIRVRMAFPFTMWQIRAQGRIPMVEATLHHKQNTEKLLQVTHNALFQLCRNLKRFISFTSYFHKDRTRVIYKFINTICIVNSTSWSYMKWKTCRKSFFKMQIDMQIQPLEKMPLCSLTAIISLQVRFACQQERKTGEERMSDK